MCDVSAADLRSHIRARLARGAAMTDLKTLYEEDTVAWSENQAAALRAAARGGSNQALDWENLAEEIEDLGKSIKRGICAQLRHIIEHLIKLEYSPAAKPRQGWRESIGAARAAIEALLEENPSLNAQVDVFIRSEIGRGAKLAIASLEGRGELDDAFRRALRTSPHHEIFHYTPDQILSDWFPPEPKA